MNKILLLHHVRVIFCFSLFFKVFEILNKQEDTKQAELAYKVVGFHKMKGTTRDCKFSECISVKIANDKSTYQGC